MLTLELLTQGGTYSVAVSNDGWAKFGFPRPIAMESWTLLERNDYGTTVLDCCRIDLTVGPGYVEATVIHARQVNGYANGWLVAFHEALTPDEVAGAVNELGAMARQALR